MTDTKALITPAESVDELKASDEIGFYLDRKSLIEFGYTEDQINQIVASFVNALTDVLRNPPDEAVRSQYRLAWEKIGEGTEE